MGILQRLIQKIEFWLSDIGERLGEAADDLRPRCPQCNGKMDIYYDPAERRNIYVCRNCHKMWNK